MTSGGNETCCLRATTAATATSLGANGNSTSWEEDYVGVLRTVLVLRQEHDNTSCPARRGNYDLAQSQTR